MIWWVLVVVVVAGLAYIRLAPHEVARWHQPIGPAQDADYAGGAVRVTIADDGALARVDAAARTLQRTEVLAGTVDEGRITYVTRSKWMGFPDYTTVEQDGDQVRMYARLRFGRSDFGVNRARLEQLLPFTKG
ncbi:MAG: DUF1499 domain-containing protein [Pseudomonadota bacterium]